MSGHADEMDIGPVDKGKGKAQEDHPMAVDEHVEEEEDSSEDETNDEAVSQACSKPLDMSLAN